MVTPIRLALIVVASATVVVGGAWLLMDDGEPREQPGAFVSRTVAQIVSDDYETAWDTLYEPHKEVAAKEEYVACELRTPVGMTLGAVRVVRVAHRLRHIPGETGRTPVELVTLKLRVKDPSLGTVDAFTHTFTAVAAGRGWAWILTPDRYELYRSDGCDV
jgi:hypothetical protein